MVTNLSSHDPAQQLAVWRREHPAATLADIEQAVDEHLRTYRAGLIEQTAQPVGPVARPVCPECGHPMQQVGSRRRTLRTAHDGRVVLSDPGWRCPECGTGLFPPE